MAYVVSVTGDDPNSEGDTFHEDAPSVSVIFPGQDGVTESECSECGYRTVDPDSNKDVCSGAPECETCEGTGESPANPELECEACHGEGRIGAHKWDEAPHAWINSATISADDDSVTVSLSVGDPRGAFTMSVERVTYAPDESDAEVTELRLSVPTPDDLWAHMGLVPLASPGYYRVVSSESPAHVAARQAIRAEIRPGSAVRVAGWGNGLFAVAAIDYAAGMARVDGADGMCGMVALADVTPFWEESPAHVTARQAESDVEYAAKARAAIAALARAADFANQEDSAVGRNEQRALALAMFLDKMGA